MKWREEGEMENMNKQDYAIKAIKEGRNTFLTGSGGVGKSWVINQVKCSDTLLCAPTGIAALNIGGITCHRAFGLPIGLPTTKDYSKINPAVRKVLANPRLKRVIIDEAAMLRVDMFDMINHRLQQARGNTKPFGGVQVVAVGDFYQLSPIVNRTEQQLFSSNHKTPFAFGSDLWKEFEVVELTKVYRQSDEQQVSILNSIRKKDDNVLQSLEWIKDNSLDYETEGGVDLLHLCSYKEDASRINNVFYNKNTNKETVYRGVTTAKYWNNNLPVEQNIALKTGCKVVICSNSPEGDYFNGQRGEIVKLYADCAEVLLDDTKKVVIVTQTTWESYKYSTTTSGKLKKGVEYEYTQLPLLLGYGITIHKSQGMSLDGISIDVGNGCFGHGQMYVALSRAKDLTNISLVKPLRIEDVILDEDVNEYYENTGTN